MRGAAHWLLVLLIIGLSLPTVTAGDEATVKIPLKDYLTLVEQAREIEEARDAAVAKAEPIVNQVISQASVLTINDETAEVRSTFEVEVRGRPEEVLKVPLTGLCWQAEVEPSVNASLSFAEDGIALVAAAPGTYTIQASSTVAIDGDSGVSRLEIARNVAPVAVTEIDLPADVAWSCTGSVVAEDQVEQGRRHLRLALRRDHQHALEMRREIKGGEAERALAQTVVVTILKLKPDGPSRHDVMLYEVSRGKLSAHRVELPPGMVVERIGTDEGDVPPIADGRTLVVQRNTRLSGSGYMVVQSRPEVEQGRLDLAPIVPTVEVRARYLTLSSNVAAEAIPAPDDSWTRVDLGDLPEEIRSSAAGLDLVAAWRWQGQTAPASVIVNRLPMAEQVQGLINRRETTTLLTVEGTLLHRDQMIVSRGASSLKLLFPQGATVWSAEVNGLAVRPLERNGATVVPLPFATTRETRVEVVSVQQRAIASGRSRVTLSAPQVTVPVLTHSWRLLLPDENRYRYSTGDLRPSEAVPFTTTGYTRFDEKADEDTGLVSADSHFGTIYGKVSYEAGPLPGVTVTATSISMQGSQSVVTDVNGSYRFAFLPPGQYRINFSLSGFNSYEHSGIELLAGRTVRVNAPMMVETFAEEIVVSSEAPSAISQSTASSYTVSSRKSERRREPSDKELQRRSQQRQQKASAREQLQSLSQGLVGGVRPVPVEIPESGKTLIMEGALPPTKVTVEIEVKAGKG
jgi:hypothetical protein